MSFRGAASRGARTRLVFLVVAPTREKTIRAGIFFPYDEDLSRKDSVAVSILEPESARGPCRAGPLRASLSIGGGRRRQPSPFVPCHPIPSHRAVCTHTYLPTAFACSTLPTVHEIRFPVPTHPCAWIRAPFSNAIHPQIASGGLHRSRLTARDLPRSTSHGSRRRNRHTDGIIHRDLVRRLGCVGGFRSRRKAL